MNDRSLQNSGCSWVYEVAAAFQKIFPFTLIDHKTNTKSSIYPEKYASLISRGLTLTLTLT